MTTLKERSTNPSREAAFAYVADFATRPQWDPNTVSSRRRSSDGGLGWRALRPRGQDGPAYVGHGVPHHGVRAAARVVLIGEGSGIWTQDTVTFTEVEHGTRVDYVADIRLSGYLGLWQPLLGRAFDAIGKGAVAGMKRELDRQARSA